MRDKAPLPEVFLAERPRVRYEIDHDDCLSDFSEQWSEFAEANGAGALEPQQLLRRPLKQFITGKEVRELYSVVFARVRQKYLSISFPFRCDSPAERRFMRMHLTPGESSRIGIECWLVRSERRQLVPWSWGAKHETAQGTLMICSTCNRARVAPDRWEEIETALADLRLLEFEAAPHLRPLICDSCKVEMFERLRDL